VLKVGGLSHGCGLHAGHEVGVSKAGRYQALPTAFVTQARKAFCVRSAHACRLGCVLLGGRRLPRTCAALLSLFAVCSTVSTGPTEALAAAVACCVQRQGRDYVALQAQKFGLCSAVFCVAVPLAGCVLCGCSTGWLCFVWLFHWPAVFCVAVPLAGCKGCGVRQHADALRGVLAEPLLGRSLDVLFRVVGALLCCLGIWWTWCTRLHLVLCRFRSHTTSLHLNPLYVPLNLIVVPWCVVRAVIWHMWDCYPVLCWCCLLCVVCCFVYQTCAVPPACLLLHQASACRQPFVVAGNAVGQCTWVRLVEPCLHGSCCSASVLVTRHRGCPCSCRSFCIACLVFVGASTLFRGRYQVPCTSFNSVFLHCTPCLDACSWMPSLIMRSLPPTRTPVQVSRVLVPAMLQAAGCLFGTSMWSTEPPLPVYYRWSAATDVPLQPGTSNACRWLAESHLVLSRAVPFVLSVGPYCNLIKGIMLQSAWQPYRTPCLAVGCATTLLSREGGCALAA
jgi:hypothetical protein